MKYPMLWKYAPMVGVLGLFLHCDRADKPEKISSEPVGVTVFAAASLTKVMQELGGEFWTKYHIPVHLSPAASGTLARQIENGAPAQIYITADPAWITYLQGKGIGNKASVAGVAQGRLVFIAPASSPLKKIDLEGSWKSQKLAPSARLALGDSGYVPAGKYAWEVLRHLGWARDLDGKTLPAQDVLGVLKLVALGEASLGIVYFSDALSSDQVKIVANIPAEIHSPILYQAMLLDPSREARAFWDFLTSTSAQKQWREAGFYLPLGHKE